MAAHTKGSVFLAYNATKFEPWPTYGFNEGGTCSDHGVSKAPADANPDLSYGATDMNLLDFE